MFLNWLRRILVCIIYIYLCYNGEWLPFKANVVMKMFSVPEPEVTISRASISDRGYPIISLSTQASYTFYAALGVW